MGVFILLEANIVSDTNGKSGTFNPVTAFPLKLALPQIYPETAQNPFTFHVKVQLVEQSEKLQQEFIMLPDAEQKGEAFHKFDAEMLASLSVKAPEGFPDFPQIKEGTELQDIIRDYFYPDDAERREGMRFICRRAMALYWKAIQPDQYL